MKYDEFFLDDLLDEELGLNDPEFSHEIDLFPGSGDLNHQENHEIFPITKIEDHYVMDEKKCEIMDAIKEASQDHLTIEDIARQVEANSDSYYSGLSLEEAEEIEHAIERIRNDIWWEDLF